MILTLMEAVNAVRQGGRDAETFKNWYGLRDPRMIPHFRRLLVWYRWFHAFLNVFTEWTRLDAQRATKFYLDVILTLALLHAI